MLMHISSIFAPTIVVGDRRRAACVPMDDVVASTNSVNADCKDITPDRVVAVASVNPVIA
jgi:hypothetical protein